MENYFCTLGEQELLRILRQYTIPIYKNFLFYIILLRIEFATFNKNATGINSLCQILDINSKKLLCDYVTSKNMPFKFLKEKIKFTSKKAVAILKNSSLKNEIDLSNNELTEKHLTILWKCVQSKIISEPLNINGFKLAALKNNKSNLVSIAHLKNNPNISGACDGPSVDIEYGPQGIPSFKQSRYKMRYHRK